MFIDVATKQTTLDDVVRQLNKVIGTANALMERYARLAEEYDSNRLAVEEIRELIKELIIEASRQADSVNKHLYRVEQYTILKGMFGIGRETLQIESEVAKEHIERALSERLVEQQKLVEQYQKNIARVGLSIAKYGETVPLVNELEEYQSKLDRALEAMKRIREQL